MTENKTWNYGKTPDIGRKVVWISKAKDLYSDAILDKIIVGSSVPDEAAAAAYKSVFWMYLEDFNMPVFPWEKLKECPNCSKDSCEMHHEGNDYYVKCNVCGYRCGSYIEANGAAMAHNAIVRNAKENNEQ